MKTLRQAQSGHQASGDAAGRGNAVTLRALIDEVHAEKASYAPGCAGCAAPCGRTEDYDMSRVWDAQEDIRRYLGVLTQTSSLDMKASVCKPFHLRQQTSHV